MVDIITGTAFDAPKRLNHREDEVALEFPSSAGSRRLGLLALRAQNWRAAKKSQLTARDYVQDGLVAMWDGIENAGWGVHDESATTWKDLVGTNDAERNVQYSSFGTDCITCNGNNHAASMLAATNILHVELAYRRQQTKYGYVLGIGQYKVGVSSQALNAFLAFKNSSDFMVGSGNESINGKIRRLYWTGVPMSGTCSVDLFNGKLFCNSVQNEDVAQLGESWGDWSGGEIGGRKLRTGNVFKGEIMCVRYYSRTLTSAEIAANYAIDKARFGLT